MKTRICAWIFAREDMEVACDVLHAIFYGYPNCESILKKAKDGSVDGDSLSSAIRREKNKWQTDPENIERACFINLTDGMSIDSTNAVFASIFGVRLGLVAMTDVEYNEAKAMLIKTISAKMIGCYLSGSRAGADDLLRRLYVISWAGVITRRKVFTAIMDINDNIGVDMQDSFQEAVNAKFHLHIFPYASCKAMISANSLPTTNAAKSTPTRHSGPCMESTNAF
jgi:hypothetical protein